MVTVTLPWLSSEKVTRAISSPVWMGSAAAKLRVTLPSSAFTAFRAALSAETKLTLAGKVMVMRPLVVGSSALISRVLPAEASSGSSKWIAFRIPLPGSGSGSGAGGV